MKDVLKARSCHYTTLNESYLADWRRQHPGELDPPKEILDELVENLVSHRYISRGLYHLYQVFVSFSFFFFFAVVNQPLSWLQC